MPQKKAGHIGATLERVRGIEPLYEAWEAAVLPLNYTRSGRDSSAPGELLQRCARLAAVMRPQPAQEQGRAFERRSAWLIRLAAAPIRPAAIGLSTLVLPIETRAVRLANLGAAHQQNGDGLGRKDFVVVRACMAPFAFVGHRSFGLHWRLRLSAAVHAGVRSGCSNL